MVAQRTLTPYVRVRILLPLPRKKKDTRKRVFSFFNEINSLRDLLNTLRV